MLYEYKQIMIFITEKHGTLLVINYVIWVLANYDY
jgi:hypothetical protein